MPTSFRFGLIIFLCLFFLRVNLPPNDIRGFSYIESQGLFLSKVHSRIGVVNNAINPVIDFMNNLMLNYQLSQLNARWVYRDFLLFKIARSESLGVDMVAIPFFRWIQI